MASSDWIKNNPKVSGYISGSTNEKFLAWMKGRNIGKISQALNILLEEYFENEKLSKSEGQNRLGVLEEKVDALRLLIKEIQKARESSSASANSTLPFIALEKKRGTKAIEKNQDDWLFDDF